MAAVILKIVKPGGMENGIIFLLNKEFASSVFGMTRC